MSSGLYSGVSGLALGTGLYRDVSGLWSGASGLIAGFDGGNPYSGASLYLDFLTMTAPSFDTRITFSRGSNATLTDSTGKITYAPANLVQQSQSIASAPWSGDTSGGSIPTATNNAGTAPDGTNTATRLQINRGAGVFSRWQQTIAASTTALHIASVWMRTYSGTGTANVGLRNGADSGVNCVVTGTWQRFWVLNTAATNLPNIQILSWTYIAGTDVSADILVWGAQLEPVTYQTTPSTYQATTSTAYYGPRFDYDPVSLSAKGLLVEEQRTNLLTYSSDWTNVAWGKINITVTAAATISPDGTVNAQKLEATAAGGATNTQTVVVAATTATYTVYVKQGTGATIANSFGIRNNTTATNLVFITLNFSTGAISYSVGSTGATATNVGNGWWRVQITASTGITSGDSITAYVGWSGAVATAGDFLYAYGAQLEAGAFATSYIPTVASTVTRSADVATMTGANFSSWYNQTAGSFVVGFDTTLLNASLSSVYSACEASDGTANNCTFLYAYSNFIGGQVRTGNVTRADINGGGSPANNTVIKSAIAYATNDVAVTNNGATPGTDTSVTLPSVNRLNIGSRYSSTNQINGHIRTIAYYNTRLPNAQLQSLTT